VYPQLQTSLLQPDDLTNERWHLGQVRLIAAVAEDSIAVRKDVFSVSKQVCGSRQGVKHRVQEVLLHSGL
jgi:hypothetical protein